MKSSWPSHPAKRAFDILFSLSLLLLLWIPLLGLALLIRLLLGSPLFFRQQRPGLHGEIFELIKFRTLKNGDQPDHERHTPLGSLLRKTGLDEIPELWNILKGDMSFIGPRPLLPQYLERYSPEQARRHDIRPGLTGWAQVHGRNNLSWEEKFEHDVWYVDHASPALDLKIIFLTFLQLFTGSGHEIPEEFNGTNPTSTPHAHS
jgi:lipopolysaccharide/colanic/teichoic acid biosynthesis glycosyltransferase